MLSECWLQGRSEHRNFLTLLQGGTEQRVDAPAPTANDIATPIQLTGIFEVDETGCTCAIGWEY